MKLLSQVELEDSWRKQISLAMRREGIRNKGCRGHGNHLILIRPSFFILN